MSTLDRRAERLTARFADEADVSVGTGFGSSQGLRVKGKIFAIFGADELVLKLPKARVDALVDAGTGTRFDPRRNGRVMKEWVVVPARHSRRWGSLADEALACVRAGAR